MTDEGPWSPQAGPQTQFLSSPADWIIFGSGAGCGKTSSILVDPLRHVHNPNYNAVILRRTLPEIKQVGGLLHAAKEMYFKLGARLNQQTLAFTFPSGAVIQLAGCQYEDTVEQWRGAQIIGLYIDELALFSQDMVFFLGSRMRDGTGCKIKPTFRGTCNPDPDSWLVKFLEWYIGSDGTPIKERSGVVRHFARVSGNIFWSDTRAELEEKGMKPISFTYISASIFDNKKLMDRNPEYLSNLEALPTHQRLQLLGGNWHAKASAGAYFPRSRAIIVDALPAGIEFVRGWDFASTEPSETNKDPDFTATVKIGRGTDGLTYIAHAEQEQINSHSVIQKLKAYHSQEPNDRIAIPIDPGAAGKYVSEDLVREVAGASITATRVSGNKEVRSRPLSAQWMAGNVRVLKAPWNAMFLDSMDGFPVGKHDDITDAANEAYALLTTSPVVNIRSL